MTQSRMTYSKTLKLNQRFETYEEFLNVLNTESKKNFDIWTKVDIRKNNVGGYLYVKFKCIYYNKLDSHLKSASFGIRKILCFVQGFRMFRKRKPGYALNACSYALNACSYALNACSYALNARYFVLFDVVLFLNCFFTMCFLLVSYYYQCMSF
jgi:hypothetical protein